MLPNIPPTFSLCFYSQTNFLEEGFRFLPFVRKGKKKNNNPEDPVNPGLLLSSKIILIGKPCGLSHGFRQSLKLM